MDIIKFRSENLAFPFAVILLLLSSILISSLYLNVQVNPLTPQLDPDRITSSNGSELELEFLQSKRLNNNIHIGTRSPDSETEPNNDITTAVNNQNQLTHAIDMDGRLTRVSDEIDYFYIDLIGGGQSNIERVNITPTFSDLGYLNDKAVGIKIIGYTKYNDKLYLLDYKALGTNQAMINDSSIPWKKSTSLYFNADRSGRYYLNVSATYIIDSATNKIIDPDAIINYTLKVTVTTVPNQDFNNDPFNGTKLTGPMGNLSINQGDDHWDWYKIESITKNREINLTTEIKIKKAIKTDNFHYVKLYGVLKCFDLVKKSWVEFSITGDFDSKYSANPLNLYLSATFDTAYLGLHSQQFEFFNNIWMRNVVECSKSNLNYDITKIQIDLINTAPSLSQWNLTLQKGSLKDNYGFQVVYQDLDNDEPKFVNITLGSVNYTMEQSTVVSNDGDYTNGELYDVTIQGTSFQGIPHDAYKNLKISFTTRDYFKELDKPMIFVKLDTFSYISVIDNVRPSIKTNAPLEWTIFEDSGPMYIDLFSIFQDPDRTKYPGEVTFKTWTDLYGWKTKAGNDYFNATILENNTIMIIPQPNQFGTETVVVQAYDSEGNLTAVEYELRVNILPVNDNPVLTQPKDFQGKEDGYVNITITATDATDKDADEITLSIDILLKIPTLGKDPSKYHYNFNEITGELSFIPDNSMVGTHLINVTATDHGTIEPIGLSTTKQFKIMIQNVNDAPIANITLPKNMAKFNTSSLILLSAENSIDEDLIYGDKLHYYWFLDNTDPKALLAYRTTPVVQLENPIKESGKHILFLKVRDESEASSWANITIWVISLIDDEPGGEDTDGDNMPDIWEIKFDLNPNIDDSGEDPDNDNLTNLQEFLGIDGKPGGGDSSNPRDPRSILTDTDGDELPDIWEYGRFSSLNQNKSGDPDGDNYNNYVEYLGVDGIPGNNDWSDPLDPKSVPLPVKSKDKDVDNTWLIIMVILVIVVVIIILLILFLFMKRKKERMREAESKKNKPFYEPEPQPIVLPQQPMGMLPGPIPGAGGIPMPLSQQFFYQPLAGGQQQPRITQPTGQAPTPIQQFTMTTPPAAVQAMPHQYPTGQQIQPQQQQLQQKPQMQPLALPPTAHVMDMEEQKKQVQTKAEK